MAGKGDGTVKKKILIGLIKAALSILEWRVNATIWLWNKLNELESHDQQSRYARRA